MTQSYKALKEGFVSNLSGGDVSEINLVTVVAPVGSNDLLFLRELIEIKFAGSRSSLVGSSGSTSFLYQSWLSRIRGRLPPQCWSYSSRNNFILCKSNLTQHLPCISSHLTLCSSSNICSSKVILKVQRQSSWARCRFPARPAFHHII